MNLSTFNKVQLKNLSLLVIFFLFSVSAHSKALKQARALIVQVSDTHSKLPNFIKMLTNIDHICQSYLEKVPDGEVVIYFNGDITGLNLFSESDKGRSTLESLRLLKERGYTVIFNLGNHDAPAWASSGVNEAELLLEQLQMLHEWGVVILTSNFVQPTATLQSVLTPYYHLKTVKEPMYLFGLTMDNFEEKSKLTRGNSPILFDGIMGYKDSIIQSLRVLNKNGVKKGKIAVGIHKGYKKLIKVSNMLEELRVSEKLGFKFPLLLAADDHIASASLTTSGTLVSDAGEYGAFNTLGIDKNGRVFEVSHYEVAKKTSEVQDFSQGSIQVQRSDLEVPDYLVDYENEISQKIDRVNKENSAPLFEFIQRVYINKNDVKKGPSLYASMTPELLRFWVTRANQKYSDEVVVAMSHSVSYKTKRYFNAGDVINGLDLNEIYPFPQDSGLFRLKGSELKILYRALKKSYAETDPGRFTPHLSLNFKETAKGTLKYKGENGWLEFEDNETYLVAMDSWLSMNLSGEGPDSKKWLEILAIRQPIMRAPHKDLVSKYWTKVLEVNGFGRRLLNSCSGSLAP